MEFYVIPPLKHLELAKKTPYKRLYCLAHLCNRTINPRADEYIEFFKTARLAGYFVTLDNGTAEGKLVFNSFLISIAREIKPNEIICPDVLYGGKDTLKRTDNFLKQIKSNSKSKKLNHPKNAIDLENTLLMGVPQGSTAKEYMK